MSADTHRLIARLRALAPYGEDYALAADALEAAEAQLAECKDVSRGRLDLGYAIKDDLLEALLRAEAAEAQRDTLQGDVDKLVGKIGGLMAQRDTLAEALRWIEQQQPKTLAMLRERGVVFKHAPQENPDDRFELIAFWIYNDLCEVDSVARAALSGVAPPEEQPR